MAACQLVQECLHHQAWRVIQRHNENVVRRIDVGLRDESRSPSMRTSTEGPETSHRIDVSRNMRLVWPPEKSLSTKAVAPSASGCVLTSRQSLCPSMNLTSPTDQEPAEYQTFCVLEGTSLVRPVGADATSVALLSGILAEIVFSLLMLFCEECDI